MVQLCLIDLRAISLVAGKTHASKDFWDPLQKRRIM